MHGLRLWDGAGNLKLDIADRLPKFVARYNINRKADEAYATDRLVAESTNEEARFNIIHTFNIHHTGVKGDGTWSAIITKMPTLNKSFMLGISDVPNYITGHCILQNGNIAVKIMTGSTFYKDSLIITANHYLQLAWPADFTIEVYRL